MTRDKTGLHPIDQDQEAPRRDIRVLNALIAALLDSAERLTEASEDSESAGHGSLFETMAAERRDTARRMQEAVIALGGHPDEGGSILAKAQRAVRDMRLALLGEAPNGTGTFDNGERTLEQRFETALAENGLSEATRELIRLAQAELGRRTPSQWRGAEPRRGAEAEFFPY